MSAGVEQKFQVALVQSELAWHDAAANRAALGERIVAAHGADLIVLPEMFASGFTMTPEAVAETMAGPTVGWLRAGAAKSGAVVCGSLVIEEDGRYFNRFVWAAPSGALQTYDKRHCFRMAGEHEHYDAGSARVVIATEALGRFLPQVCYDLRFPVFSRSLGDYDVILYVANWPAARQAHWDTLLRARAIENQSYVIAVNRIGCDGNDVVYGGGSAVINPLGETLCHGGDADLVLRCSVDIAQVADCRRQFPAWQDRDEFALAPPRHR